ncbi:MAG: hypothetical protein JXA30_06035 [Deltaproteobacteria bacterium]|nr:hypothetical protein [Deltaproteobacteria bacterium]
MATAVQTTRNQMGSAYLRDEEIPFKSGRNVYLATLVVALTTAAVVMWSLFYL